MGGNIIDHSIMGANIFDIPIFLYIGYKASLKCQFIFQNVPKATRSTGECLIISSFINAANIGKNFMKMFHNSWGANNFGHNCKYFIELKYKVVNVKSVTGIDIEATLTR